MATTRNFANWFYVSSREFHDAYNALAQDRSGRNDFIAVKHYLLCHALETSLKGLLAETGNYSYNQLRRNFSHNLLRLLDEVEHVRGASTEIDECRAYVRPINEDYMQGGYGYPNNNVSFTGIQLEHFTTVVQFFVDTLMTDISSYNFADVPMQ